jgi:hypothetical protein
MPSQATEPPRIHSSALDLFRQRLPRYPHRVVASGSASILTEDSGLCMIERPIDVVGVK